MELNSLERMVMEMLLTGDEPALQILADQFRTATVSSREMTGVGFYTTFMVAPQEPRLNGAKSLQLSDVSADIEGLEHGAGFVLFVKDGMINFLEGYSFDESWPAHTDNFRLSYIGRPTRDLASLRQDLG